MSDNLITSVVTVLTAIIGVAVIAVLVSQRAQTSAVLRAGGGAFSSILGSALSPVTGGTFTFPGGVSVSGN
jgi:uncharacterized membrane protein YbjE (DUF340 family)